MVSDGTVYVVGDEVVALPPDGRSRPGWSYRPAGSLIGPCFDSECFGGNGALAFGPDGTVYLVVFHTDAARVRAEVVAIDRQGQLKPGWPYRLPFDGLAIDISTLAVSLAGRLFVEADTRRWRSWPSIPTALSQTEQRAPTDRTPIRTIVAKVSG